MVIDKYIVVIGLSEEDTAHLRLLMRQATPQLLARWRWGTEDNADLVVVDPESLAGQMGRNRAFSGGRRCAVYSLDELRKDEMRLTKPLKLDNVVETLNSVSANAVNLGAEIIQQHDDFYELGELSPQFDLEEDEVATARAERRDIKPAQGLDELFKPDTAADSPRFAVPVKLDENTTIEGTTGPSVRSDTRVADSMGGLRKPEAPTAAASAPPVKRGVSPDATRYPLREFLSGNLLAGPVMLAPGDGPALALDPKQQVFHCAGSLSSLTPYCAQMFARAEWRTLTTTELTKIRTEQPAQPYTHLIWLIVLTQSGGHLARHLHPGGRYRLKHWLPIERDLHHNLRVAAVMRQPAKLNEIAAASGATMAEVFDLVNAYDAIDLLEIESRPPGRADPKAATAHASGLLARIRKSFGRT